MNSEAEKQLLTNWVPYQLSMIDEQLLCRWFYAGSNRFVEPFFEETIMHCLSHPYNSGRYKSVTALEGLVESSLLSPAIEPTAFIFHISRCGSTLLSQLLSIPERHIMVSEMPLIDQILQSSLASLLSTAKKEMLLRAVIRLLGRQRSGEESQLFIKLDSWHLGFYDTFRRLYPDVPFILLYRSPDAVLHSHQKRRGMQTVPGLIEPALFCLTADEVKTMTLDDYTVTVLTHYFRRMISIIDTDTNAHLLGYQQNGAALLANLLTLIPVDVSPDEMDQLLQRSQFHSKYPGQLFQEDTPKEATEADLVSIMGLYNQLNAKKTPQHLANEQASRRP